MTGRSTDLLRSLSAHEFFGSILAKLLGIIYDY